MDHDEVGERWYVIGGWCRGGLLYDWCMVIGWSVVRLVDDDNVVYYMIGRR